MRISWVDLDYTVLRYCYNGFNAVNRWTRKVNIFETGLIFFPIHLDSPFFLIEFFLTVKLEVSDFQKFLVQLLYSFYWKFKVLNWFKKPDKEERTGAEIRSNMVNRAYVPKHSRTCPIDHVWPDFGSSFRFHPFLA